MWKHGSGFTEQPSSPGAMSPSSLWPLAGLGGSVGGEKPEHSLQEDLEPSHTALAAMKLEPKSVLSRRSMQPALFLVLFLSVSCPPGGAPLSFGFRHPWKRGWTEAPRQRLEQEPAGLCLPPGPKGRAVILPPSQVHCHFLILFLEPLTSGLCQQSRPNQ